VPSLEPTATSTRQHYLVAELSTGAPALSGSKWCKVGLKRLQLWMDWIVFVYWGRRPEGLRNREGINCRQAGYREQRIPGCSFVVYSYLKVFQTEAYKRDFGKMGDQLNGSRRIVRRTCAHSQPLFLAKIGRLPACESVLRIQSGAD